VIWKPSYKIELITIKAHESDISCIALSKDGNQFVSCSKNATLIKVFNSTNGELINEFRRNTNVMPLTNSFIWDVCISHNKKYVACCSSRGTIHIFDTQPENNSQNKKSLLSQFGSVMKYFDSKWSAYTIPIGNNDEKLVKTICAFDKLDNLNVATYDGDYYKLDEKEKFGLKRTSLNLN